MNVFGEIMAKCADILLGYGLPGVIIIVLLLAVRKLYNRNCTLQDARVIDAQTQTTALNANTNALNRITDALRSARPSQ